MSIHVLTRHLSNTGGFSGCEKKKTTYRKGVARFDRQRIIRAEPGIRRLQRGRSWWWRQQEFRRWSWTFAVGGGVDNVPHCGIFRTWSIVAVDRPCGFCHRLLSTSERVKDSIQTFTLAKMCKKYMINGCIGLWVFS